MSYKVPLAEYRARVAAEKEARAEAFAEERAFFRDVFGMKDWEIAERLGIDWPSYCRYMQRHPELGPVDKKFDADEAWVQDVLYPNRKKRGRK